MTEHYLTPNLAELPSLDDDAIDDARFRGADRHWSSLGMLFDRYAKEQGLTYAALGKRIRRTRSQVQRWMQSPANMTLSSAGLLAEGLDADLEVVLVPRGPSLERENYAHPCVRAAEHYVVMYSKPMIVELGVCMVAAETSTTPKQDVTTTQFRAAYA